ncbi:DUF1559 domain-containing protein [bacterium]|nr:DUF1559 domain-containing protein [bacterium]
MKNRGNARTVILVSLGIFAGLIVLCTGFATLVLSPMIKQAQRASTENNLKGIILALQDYHDTFGSYPPAYLADENGQPKHSWRVLILPYLFQDYLYEAYDFDQPWDSPDNLWLIELMPEVYAVPGMNEVNDQGKTSFLAVAGPTTAISTEKGQNQNQIARGRSNTILVVVDTQHPIPWTQPDDISPEVFLSTNLDEGYFGSTLIGLGDVGVQFIHENEKQKLPRMISTDDEESEQPAEAPMKP